MHIVVNGFPKTLPQEIVINTGGVGKGNIVLGKSNWWQGLQGNAIGCRVFTDGRMHRAGEAVKEAALNTAVLK